MKFKFFYLFRQKHGTQSEGILIHSVQNGIALEFERSDSTRRLRLVLSEILGIAAQVIILYYC